jgi:hypothetical protein
MPATKAGLNALSIGDPVNYDACPDDVIRWDGLDYVVAATFPNGESTAPGIVKEQNVTYADLRTSEASDDEARYIYLRPQGRNLRTPMPQRDWY